MSDHEASNKKRSHSDSEAEEARDHVGSLPERRTNSTSARKKPRLGGEPRRPFASANDIPDVRERPVTPKNQKPHPASAPIHATPMKPSASESVQPEGEATFLDKHVKDYIKNELGTREGAIVRDYPVIDFIRNVWGFRPELIPRGRTGYVLSGELVESYEQSEYTKTKKYMSGERNSCLAFEEIVQTLTEQIEDNKAETGSSLPSGNFDGELEFLRELVLDGDYANFRPDYAFVRKGSLKTRELHWHQPGVIGEQKRRKKFKRRFRKNVTIDPGKLLPNKGNITPGDDAKPKRKRRRRNGAGRKVPGTSQIPTQIVWKQAAMPDSTNEQASDQDEVRDYDLEPMLLSGADQTDDDDGDNGSEVVPGTDQNDLGPHAAGPSRIEPTIETTGNAKLAPSHVDTLTNEEVQIAKYLNELLSHGVRQYASGFLVEDQWISLWYGDRYGVVKSAFFDWIAEPHFLLLLVAALRFADTRRLGFSPFVTMDPQAPIENPYRNATLSLTGSRYPEDEEAMSIYSDGARAENKAEGGGDGDKKKGSKRGKGKAKVKGTKAKAKEIAKGKARATEDSKGEGERKENRAKEKDQPQPHRPISIEGPLKVTNGKGEQIEQSLEFPIDLDPTTSQRRLYTQYGLVGRGTTVIPVKVTGGQITATALRLAEDTSLVAKLAWQHVDRRKEDAFIRQIRQALNIKEDPYSQSMLKHVVNMLCSLSLPMHSSYVHLPRAFMSLLPDIDPADLREFRLLMLEAYEPLCNIPTVEDFKKVFRETFQAHHWIWTKANILHRDISVNNIMFRIRNNSVEGVLCDWDLSATKADLGLPVNPSERGEKAVGAENQHLPAPPSQPNNEQPRQKPRYRTGTGPFMALELLKSRHGTTPVHKYSFDVQSFFYVLCWVIATHDPEKKTIGVIPQWMNKRFNDTYTAKADFLSDHTSRDRVFQKAHPSYLPLINSWVKRLLPMFRRADELWRTLQGSLDQILGEDDEDEAELLRAEIAEKTGQYEGMITYEGFLSKLS
ncbi:hypothetical protein K474DRAFT_1712059 [Panus rudis PR-1116 ss-1]|nr:hypothetical protein K474DRAFT_1712059 [Panus rudis PR-1116 ss-1]